MSLHSVVIGIVLLHINQGIRFDFFYCCYYTLLRKLDLSRGMVPSLHAYIESYAGATSPNNNQIVDPLILVRVRFICMFKTIASEYYFVIKGKNV